MRPTILLRSVTLVPQADCGDINQQLAISTIFATLPLLNHIGPRCLMQPCDRIFAHVLPTEFAMSFDPSVSVVPMFFGVARIVLQHAPTAVFLHRLAVTGRWLEEAQELAKLIDAKLPHLESLHMMQHPPGPFDALPSKSHNIITSLHTQFCSEPALRHISAANFPNLTSLDLVELLPRQVTSRNHDEYVAFARHLPPLRSFRFQFVRVPLAPSAHDGEGDLLFFAHLDASRLQDVHLVMLRLESTTASAVFARSLLKLFRNAAATLREFALEPSQLPPDVWNIVAEQSSGSLSLPRMQRLCLASATLPEAPFPLLSLFPHLDVLSSHYNTGVLQDASMNHHRHPMASLPELCPHLRFIQWRCSFTNMQVLPRLHFLSQLRALDTIEFFQFKLDASVMDRAELNRCLSASYCPSLRSLSISECVDVVLDDRNSVWDPPRGLEILEIVVGAGSCAKFLRVLNHLVELLLEFEVAPDNGGNSSSNNNGQAILDNLNASASLANLRRLNLTFNADVGGKLSSLTNLGGELTNFRLANACIQDCDFEFLAKSRAGKSLTFISSSEKDLRVLTIATTKLLLDRTAFPMLQSVGMTSMRGDTSSNEIAAPLFEAGLLVCDY